MIIDYGARL